MYYNLFAYPFIFPLCQEDILNDDLSFTVRRNNQVHFLQKIINDLITNNNNLPDYIQQEINKMSSGIDGKVAALERFYDWAEQTYATSLEQYQILQQRYVDTFRDHGFGPARGYLYTNSRAQRQNIQTAQTTLNNKMYTNIE